jgi:uncharacterized protein (TIGR02391 family)
MIEWYVSLRRLLRDIEKKSRDALEFSAQGKKEAFVAVNGYLLSDYEKLVELWRQRFSASPPSHLGRHIRFGMDGDYRDILSNDLKEIESAAEKTLLEYSQTQGPLGFEGLLHPAIEKSTYQLYRGGHLREAVLNSVVAVFDHIRLRTNIQADGEALIGKAFSLSDPYLILSELDSESGKNEQKGFVQIFKGAYQGIRNPKAHSLEHDPNATQAAQYMVFMSLLVRRVDEARIVKRDP